MSASLRRPPSRFMRIISGSCLGSGEGSGSPWLASPERSPGAGGAPVPTVIEAAIAPGLRGCLTRPGSAASWRRCLSHVLLSRPLSRGSPVSAPRSRVCVALVRIWLPLPARTCSGRLPSPSCSRSQPRYPASPWGRDCSVRAQRSTAGGGAAAPQDSRRVGPPGGRGSAVTAPGKPRAPRPCRSPGAPGHAGLPGRRGAGPSAGVITGWSRAAWASGVCGSRESPLPPSVGSRRSDAAQRWSPGLARRSGPAPLRSELGHGPSPGSAPGLAPGRAERERRTRCGLADFKQTSVGRSRLPGQVSAWVTSGAR